MAFKITETIGNAIKWTALGAGAALMALPAADAVVDFFENMAVNMVESGQLPTNIDEMGSFQKFGMSLLGMARSGVDWVTDVTTKLYDAVGLDALAGKSGVLTEVDVKEDLGLIPDVIRNTEANIEYLKRPDIVPAALTGAVVGSVAVSEFAPARDIVKTAADGMAQTTKNTFNQAHQAAQTAVSNISNQGKVAASSIRDRVHG